MIVAVAENGVIGRDNDLPWHLPADQRFFKQCTMGKPVILGRKTFESIGKPLPGRHFVVVTRNPDWRAAGVRVARDPDVALQGALELAVELDVDEVMVAGGAELYTLYLDRADRIYRTLVCCAPEGDAVFPELGAEWIVKSSRREDDGGLEICFQTLEKGC